MLPFSYTLSDVLRLTLQKTDNLRMQIEATPLPPKIELKLRWEAMLDRIYYMFILDQHPIQKKALVDLMTVSPLIKRNKKYTAEDKEVLKYKQGLDYISQEWYVNPAPLSIKTAVYLHGLACPGRYRNDETELKQLIAYLETNPDHPIIQAAVVYACILRSKPFTDGNGRIASLLALLMLYKAGYDCRGFLNIEKEWLNHREAFTEKLEQGMKSAYMTGWIEFVAEVLATQLDYKLQDIKIPRSTHDSTKTFFDLNNRQKSALTLLNEPNARITNRDMQKLFKISQITASRDLAHMVLLGLLIPHGKGRSIYYTKIAQ